MKTIDEWRTDEANKKRLIDLLREIDPSIDRRSGSHPESSSEEEIYAVGTPDYISPEGARGVDTANETDHVLSLADTLMDAMPSIKKEVQEMVSAWKWFRNSVFHFTQQSKDSNLTARIQRLANKQNRNLPGTDTNIPPVSSEPEGTRVEMQPMRSGSGLTGVYRPPQTEGVGQQLSDPLKHPVYYRAILPSYFENIGKTVKKIKQLLDGWKTQFVEKFRKFFDKFYASFFRIYSYKGILNKQKDRAETQFGVKGTSTHGLWRVDNAQPDANAFPDLAGRNESAMDDYLKLRQSGQGFGTVDMSKIASTQAPPPPQMVANPVQSPQRRSSSSQTQQSPQPTDIWGSLSDDEKQIIDSGISGNMIVSIRMMDKLQIGRGGAKSHLVGDISGMDNRNPNTRRAIEEIRKAYPFIRIGSTVKYSGSPYWNIDKFKRAIQYG